MLRRWLIPSLLVAAAVASGPACETVPTRAPGSAPSNTVLVSTLNRDLAIDALNYWRDAAGITYVLEASNLKPRLLIRPGTDSIPPWGGGRALTDETDDVDNRMLSGLVVIETGTDTKPAGGTYCAAPASMLCRYLYRHEIGHTFGFIGHSGLTGLMQSGADTLHERELRMIVALYKLPHGARVQPDGQWHVAGSTSSGRIDTEIAADIIEWNMNAVGGRSYRSQDMITRWELPVTVVIVDRIGG